MCHFSKQALNVMTAKTYKGVGRSWIVRNMESNMSEEMIVERLNMRPKAGKTTIREFEMVRDGVKKKVRAITEYMDGITAYGDPDFPEVRGDVKESERPIVLFYKGDLGLLHKENRNIAVIGLLTPSESVVREEKAVVENLVEDGYTIVSGLALGCDSVAHRTTLKVKGKTIAILPSTLKTITPNQNRDLAQDILAANGLLVTEYMDEPSSKMELTGRYQERDRLQALFSDGVVLSASYAPNEKGLDSGSRLAMGYAKSYRIPRYVIYDEAKDATDPMCDLSRQLMEDRDVVLVQSDTIRRKVTSRPKYVKAEQLLLF